MTAISQTLRKVSGFRFFERNSRGWELRFRWAEITSGFGLGLGLMNWSEDGDWSLHIHLPWPNIYLKLPFLPSREPKEQMLDSWSFSLFEDAIHLHWGHRTKIIHLPWSLDWHRTSVLLPDGRGWRHELARRPKPPLGTDTDGYFLDRDLPRWSEEYPFRYVLRSGEVQERTATVSIEEREWRRRGWRWLPLFRRVRRSIDVQFSDEVGERTGSWKGGTVGCGYELRPHETPRECLLRMQEERKL